MENCGYAVKDAIATEWPVVKDLHLFVLAYSHNWPSLVPQLSHHFKFCYSKISALEQAETEPQPLRSEATAGRQARPADKPIPELL